MQQIKLLVLMAIMSKTVYTKYNKKSPKLYCEAEQSLCFAPVARSCSSRNTSLCPD